METGEEIRSWITEVAEEAIVWEPADYDAAIIGVAARCGMEPVVVYDFEKLIEITMGLSDGATYEEALEHVTFNITGAYVGERTPMALYTPLQE